MRQGRAEIVQDAAQIDPLIGGQNQQRRVDWRLEQRKLTYHALNIHAVTDFEQAVGNRIPVGEQLIVLRDTEIKGVAHAEQGVSLGGNLDGGKRTVDGELVFQQPFGVGEVVQQRAELGVGLRLEFPSARHFVRSWAEN